MFIFAYSPVADLWRVLTLSPTMFVVFAAVILLPIAVSYILWRSSAGKKIKNIVLFATLFVTIGSFIWLLTLGPPAGLSPVGMLFFPFLILYLPVWAATILIVWLVFWILKKV